MKQVPTFFLKIVIIVVSLGVLALCIFALPAIPNGNAPTQAIENALYLFLAAAYVSAIPFYLAAYQALKLLKYIETEKVFSDVSVKALKIIKYCGVAISVSYLAGMPFMYLFAEEDDAPGVILVGAAFVAAPLVVSVFAAVLQKLMQAVVKMKSENDLTV